MDVYIYFMRAQKRPRPLEDRGTTLNRIALSDIDGYYAGDSKPNANFQASPSFT
jgi:hypothetical protein